MGLFNGNQKEEPLHYGEVFSIWMYLLNKKASIAGNQTYYNHAGDEDLKKLLQEAIQTAQDEIKQIEKVLKANGVGLPPAPPERPHADREEIPVGARFMDAEISASISALTAAGLIACSTIMGQSIREDIAMMFGQFHTQNATFGAKLLRLNKEKGWLVPPPLHYHKAEDN